MYNYDRMLAQCMMHRLPDIVTTHIRL